MDIDLTKNEYILLEKFNSEYPVEAIFEDVQCLTQFHLLKRCSKAPDTWKLTREGRIVLEAYQQQRDDRAQENAKQRRQEIQRIKERKQDRRDKWLIGFGSACFGSVLTLCIEHFDKILVFLAKLFH